MLGRPAYCRAVLFTNIGFLKSREQQAIRSFGSSDKRQVEVLSNPQERKLIWKVEQHDLIQIWVQKSGWAWYASGHAFLWRIGKRPS